MSFEKWFDITHEYVYVYSCDGHIVKTVDKTGKKEYNYTYDEGSLVRAVEYDITMTGDIVTSKTRVVTVSYVYNDEGELLKNRAVFADGSESSIIPARNAADNTDSSQFYSNASGTADFVTSSETDGLGRKTKDYFVTDSGRIERSFTYHDGEVTAEHTLNGKVKGNATTELVDKITYSDGRTTQYEYDAEERITKVTDSIDGITEYTYDSLGQLLTEKRNGVVINSMTYDGYGNIKSKNGSIYTYGDSTWDDLLTHYNGQQITYDAQGNPTTYRGKSLVWEKGRQLKSYDGITYTYNANGIRTSKTVGGVKHTYILDGTRILKETWGTNTIIPLYDNEDNVCGICYNGKSYYFVKNLQGDVVSLITKKEVNGEAVYTVVANYTYDAWGVCTVTDAEGNENTTSSFIGNINPYRYRSYYYDSETGLYYLQSRYYDAEVGRFINGDEAKLLCATQKSTIRNLYAYCINNPTNYIDPSGYLAYPGEIHNYVQLLLASYIYLYLKCFTYVDYFIRFGFLKYGFADLYAKSWGEIWEIKPDKNKYYLSGPKQLQKYLDALSNTKAGRNLGNFKTYYFSTLFYEVTIRSNSNDGMIYYSYKTNEKINGAMLLAVTSFILIATGVGSSAGVAGMSGAGMILLA